MLSPYVLDYAARISVILLPWAALPWLIGLAMRSARQGGWRWPAWFALVIALVGGVNATALLFAGIAPVLWFVYAVWVAREVEVRRALAAAGRIGLLTVGVSLWWIAGLWAQGRYGIPILRYTETYETVAKVSNAPELLRGLGYWFFYGDDKLGPWIEPSVDYTQHLWLIGAGYLLGIGALLAAGAVRWKERGYFVALLAIGTLIAVGLTSLRRSVAVRLAVRPLHPPRPRARPALDTSSRAADHPCARCHAGRRSPSARAVASPARPRRRDGSGRRRRHQPAPALHRPDGREQLAAS